MRYLTTKTMSKQQPLNELIDNYTKALIDDNAAIFAGAGLSISSGYVDWPNLLRTIAKDVGLDVDKEHDLISIAQFHKNEHNGRHRINQVLIDEFTKNSVITENHNILANLPISTYWTTNYDQIIEEALKSAGKLVDVKRTQNNLAINVPRRDAVVYKMHGDIEDADKAVLIKDDYEAYNETRQLFSVALQGDLVSKTFLFIGMSFRDPNLNYILSRIRVLLGENKRQHYCLMKKENRKNYKSAKEFIYAQTKQNLQISDLKRYGILGVLVNDYGEYTEVLRKIDSRFRKTRVFISGSFSESGIWKSEDVYKALENMSAKLIERGFNIVSGFGLGVGSAVINGALRQLRSTNTWKIDDRLILRPFPQYSPQPNKLSEHWKKYREEIVPLAGIAIILFGNKIVDGNIVDANGVLEEFDIAKKNGLIVVPVGDTGYVSERLHKKVLDHFDTYYGKYSGLKTKFMALKKNETNLERIMGRVVDFAEIIRDKYIMI